jgi:hypothetical protein
MGNNMQKQIGPGVRWLLQANADGKTDPNVIPLSEQRQKTHDLFRKYVDKPVDGGKPKNDPPHR